MSLPVVRPSLLAAVAIALALVLGGCSASGEAATAPSSSADGTTPSVSDSPSSPEPAGPPAAPVPSSTPSSSSSTVDPDDPATWTIGFDGIGPLVLGGSFSAPVSDVLTERPEAEGEAGICRHFSAPGTDPLVTTVSDEPDLIHGVFASVEEAPTGSPRTPEGIGTGSSTEELLAAYPDAVLTDDGLGRSYAITNGEGRYIHFLPGEDGRILGIYVLVSPELPSEFCV